MVVTKLNDKKNNNMLCFKTLTLAPIDINLINYTLLSHEEIGWINNYNSSVYNNISIHLESGKKKWLKKVCKPYI